MLYIYIFFKFFKKIRILSKTNKTVLVKINKKKNLFFKRRTLSKYFLSKRVSTVLKKRKKIKSFKRKHIDKGNFFFKKFFFKTINKNRKFMKNFFFLPNKVRQKKITKKIYNNSKNTFINDSSYEYTLLNITLRSGIFFFFQDTMLVLKKSLIYVNCQPVQNFHMVLNVGDCIQLNISKKVYRYIKFCVKFLKKRAALLRYNA